MKREEAATRPSICAYWSAGWLATFLLAIAPVADGHGEELPAAGQGQLKAVAAGPPPQRGTRVAIEPSADDVETGDDPIYVAARRAVVRALTARGLRESDTATLTLDIRIDLTSFHARPSRPPGNLSGQRTRPAGGSDLTQVEPQFGIPIGRDARSRQSMIAVVLTLFEPGATPIWNATVQAADDVDGRERLVGRLVEAAMRAFGHTVFRDFVLTCAGPSKAGDESCP